MRSYYILIIAGICVQEQKMNIVNTRVCKTFLINCLKAFGL